MLNSAGSILPWLYWWWITSIIFNYIAGVEDVLHLRPAGQVPPVHDGRHWTWLYWWWMPYIIFIFNYPISSWRWCWGWSPTRTCATSPSIIHSGEHWQPPHLTVWICYFPHLPLLFLDSGAGVQNELRHGRSSLTSFSDMTSWWTSLAVAAPGWTRCASLPEPDTSWIRLSDLWWPLALVSPTSSLCPTAGLHNKYDGSSGLRFPSHFSYLHSTFLYI